MATPKHILLFLFLLSLNQIAFSQEGNGGVKFSNDFLNIGVGAASQGMGKANVASINNGDAIYWNPAGLSLINSSFQVNAMHSQLYTGVAKYDYISFAKTLNSKQASTFGVSAIRLAIDDIPNTLNLVGPDGSINYNEVSSFSDASYGIFFSYGTQLKVKGLRIGGSSKIILRSSGKFAKARGFGVDLGLQYDISNWTFGLMLRDITTTFNSWKFTYTEDELLVLQETGNELVESSTEITRPQIILGTAFQKRFGAKENTGLLVEMDMNFTTDGQRNVLVSSPKFNMDPMLGLQFDYKKLLFLRTGINNFQQIKNTEGGTDWSYQPNIGIGLKISVFTLNYALSNQGNIDNAYSHIVSLTLDLKQKEKSNKDLPKKIQNPKKQKSQFPDYIEQI